MNKSELVDRVASEAGVNKGQAESVLDAFFETVKSATKSGDKVSWPGVGSFSTSQRGARTGRNPQTGESIKIGASTNLKFKPVPGLKDYYGGKKSAAKKATAKKATAKKATAKKATAKKTAAKKAAKKR